MKGQDHGRKGGDIMKLAPKIAAVAYFLWGLIHIAGGAAMLSASFTGPESFLEMLTGTEHTVSVDAPESIGSFDTFSANEVFAFHSFNIVWLGFVAAVVAVRLNWKNSAAGYWTNMAVIGWADVGLILFMVRPGVMDLSDAWIGPLLFLVGVVFSTIGRYSRSAGMVSPVVGKREVGFPT
jgi:hypothetical protein